MPLWIFWAVSAMLGEVIMSAWKRWSRIGFQMLLPLQPRWSNVELRLSSLHVHPRVPGRHQVAHVADWDFASIHMNLLLVLQAELLCFFWVLTALHRDICASRVWHVQEVLPRDGVATAAVTRWPSCSPLGAQLRGAKELLLGQDFLLLVHSLWWWQRWG